MRTTTHALTMDRRLEPRRLVPRRQPAQPNDYESDARFAYLEWLEMEARLLRIELYPDTDPDRQPTPRGTFAKSFHFPTDGTWKDVPLPSTRAEAVLAAVGVGRAA